MAKDDPTIYIRLPAELKMRLEEGAAESRRSLTGEVAARLQHSFEVDELLSNLRTEITRLKVQVELGDATSTVQEPVTGLTGTGHDSQALKSLLGLVTLTVLMMIERLPDDVKRQTDVRTVQDWLSEYRDEEAKRRPPSGSGRGVEEDARGAPDTRAQQASSPMEALAQNEEDRR